MKKNLDRKYIEKMASEEFGLDEVIEYLKEQLEDEHKGIFEKRVKFAEEIRKVFNRGDFELGENGFNEDILRATEEWLGEGCVDFIKENKDKLIETANRTGVEFTSDLHSEKAAEVARLAIEGIERSAEIIAVASKESESSLILGAGSVEKISSEDILEIIGNIGSMYRATVAQ